MTNIIYRMVMLFARLEYKIEEWNYNSGAYLDDKQLHFVVLGITGMLLLLVIYPLFKLLSKKHVLAIAWIYVFTVMFVLAFSIEIGQWIYGTGRMEMEDVTAGLSGFLLLFVIFVFIRFIVLTIHRSVQKGGSDRKA
ncbi:MAG: hypothetical protein IJH91_00610 [Mogibacterium sp.]|nr:hypothetical protein [Mogibacterium sp.]